MYLKKITRISKKSTKSYLPINPISPLEDFIDISNKELQELHKERYSFLVKRMPVTSQKNRTSEMLLLKVISELFSDDNSDDVFKEENERVFEDIEDNTLEYSSDNSDEDF